MSSCSFFASEQLIHSALRIYIPSKKTLLQIYKLSHDIWIHRMHSLALISYCFSLAHIWKKHVRSSSRPKYAQPPLLCSFLDLGKNLILLPQSWSYLLLLLRGAWDGNSHPWRTRISVLACFSLSFNQILIGCSHFTTHRKYMREMKKVILPCL